MTGSDCRRPLKRAISLLILIVALFVTRAT
jgi:hypothetical protein